MDPRLKALIEIRELLVAEGWAADEVSEDRPPGVSGKKFSSRTNPILLVISLAAIATNFILIGANHDLRQVTKVNVSIVDVRVEWFGTEQSSNPLKTIFVTVDGEKVWVGNSEREAGTKSPEEISRPSSVALQTKGLLQLWSKDQGRDILLGQSSIEPVHPRTSTFQFDLLDNHPLKLPAKIIVILKIVKDEPSPFLSSQWMPGQ